MCNKTTAEIFIICSSFPCKADLEIIISSIKLLVAHLTYIISQLMQQ